MRALRNIAIIAHVDHGKTTLVDHMLRQTGAFRANEVLQECVLDSNDLERERGITILAKNTSVTFRGTKINIIDTPGHHDFGGEVERVLQMVTGALVLVDAADGPMPQTRYVLQKALRAGLDLILVINKCDRPEARPEHTFEALQYVLLELDAKDRQLHAPVLYAIGREGRSKRSLQDPWSDLAPLFECIVEHIPPPEVSVEAPFVLGVSALDYDDYVGRMAIGKIAAGRLSKDAPLLLLKRDSRRLSGTALRIETFEYLDRREVESAEAGEIVRIAGLPDVDLGDTLAASEDASPIPFPSIDEPTLSMNFLINDSPLSGREGTLLTANFLRDRLFRETLSDPALRVEPTESPDRFRVSGRGLLHLSILIENMRREGFELQVSRPEIIFRQVGGKTLEPIERAEIDLPEDYLGKVLELLGNRKGAIEAVEPRQSRMHIRARIPTRALIGLPGKILGATRGNAVLHSALDGYGEYRGEIPERQMGVIVTQGRGEATTYALDGLRTRGTFFVVPGDAVYEGMIVGEHVHERDIMANVARKRKLTNIRASSADSTTVLPQARVFSLEEALEYINPDELVEITPKRIRLRKKILKEHLRKRAKE